MTGPRHGWTTRDVVTVSGPDAQTYLQGQLSQDVSALGAGDAAATFVLAPQGKVDGWGRILRVDDDTFRIDVDSGAGAAWDARLRRFLLRTRAEIEVTSDVGSLIVRGTDAVNGLAPLGPGVLGVDLVGQEGEPAGLPDDSTLLGADEVEAVRIIEGVPRWGAEIDADTIPATLGQWVIDASVSFTKGCYTGQELVARIDSRGGNVPRRMVGLRAEERLEAGQDIVVAGAVVGQVTSAAEQVGLGFVARSVEIDVEPVWAETAAGPVQLIASRVASS